MEKHFLDGQFDGPQAFNAEPTYNPIGDCIQYQLADEALVADRIDDILTIYRSAVDNRPIGYQIKDVLAIISASGWDGLSCMSSEADGEVTSVSLSVLLLAAYERGQTTIDRRTAYASAMEQSPGKRIARKELVAV